MLTGACQCAACTPEIEDSRFQDRMLGTFEYVVSVFTTYAQDNLDIVPTITENFYC